MESDGESPAPAPAHTCGAGHRPSHSLATSSGGRLCLSCAAALLSDPSAPSHHLAHVLAHLSVALADPAFLAALRAAHPRLLAAPLASALASAASRRDAPLAAQAADVAADLASAAGPAAAIELVAYLSHILASGSLVKHLHTLHCLGVLLNSSQDNGAALHIRDKLSLFANLVNDLRLPSEEIRGEILFVLYKLSLLQATPWDNICDNGFADLSAIGRSSLQLSLEVLLKTQNDDVRMNCVALLLVLAKKGVFDNLLVDDQTFINAAEAEDSMQTDYISLNAPFIVLFADAVKGSLLSTSVEVQAGTLDLIFHFLSSDVNSFVLVQALIEESVADYVFEVLRLSGNNDALVVSCIQVLSLLATSEKIFKERLAIGFSTLLPVLHYVAEIPFHPVQSHVLRLVWICIVNCLGIMSISQEEETARTLTAIFRRNSNEELGVSSETFILACLTFVEIMKSPSACDIHKLPSFIQEASRHAISSILSHDYNYMLLPHSLYLLKEALLFSLEGNTDQNSGKKDLEDSIIETCGTYLLPWLESAVVDLDDEEVLLGILELCQIILLKASDHKTWKFADMLASSSWFSLSFGFLGLFPSDHVKSRVYLVTSSVVDKVLGCKYGETIRNAYIYLPSDPTEFMYLLGQRNSEDLNLASCQYAILVMLYVCSLYSERLADENQILASIEQYVLVNGGNFSYEITGSMMRTLLVHLYAFVRGTSFSCSIPHSPEAEKSVFHVVAQNEWDLLMMRVHPAALKWLFQQEELMEPLSFQMLNFCKTYCADKTFMLSDGSQLMDMQMIAELVFSGDSSITLLLVSLLSQVVEEGKEDEALSVVTVIAGILVIFPRASDQFCSCSIVDALHSIYCSPYSSRIITTCSFFVFNILYSASEMVLSQEDEWLALTVKLLEHFKFNLDYTSCGQEQQMWVGILCLILHHSTKKVLNEPAKAIVLNNSLVSLMDGIVQEACAKGPALVEHNEETDFGELLIFVLLLAFFSLKSLHAILQGNIDWQDFLQHSNDVQSLSVLGIACHDLCRLMHFGPSPVKLIASQCLLELLTRISGQRNCLNSELRCCVRYLKSIMAVTEGLLFSEDSNVAGNCGVCLSTILGWEKVGTQEKRTAEEHRWCRLIMEELAVALTAPGLVSKSFTNQQKFAANLAVSLLKLNQVPDWLKSLLDGPLISGIVANLSARNVTTEIVKLFRELMARKYLNQEQIVALHHLFQICRRQVYEESSRTQLSEEKHGKAVTSSDEIRGLLLDMMLNQNVDSDGVQMEQQKLLHEIDLFSQESRRQE